MVVCMPEEVMAQWFEALDRGDPAGEGAAPQEKQLCGEFGICAEGSHAPGLIPAWLLQLLLLCLGELCPPALLFPPRRFVRGPWGGGEQPRYPEVGRAGPEAAPWGCCLHEGLFG